MQIDPLANEPQRIAVIGGGISGLASAWLLGRRHRVTLYEAENRLGGHARTVMAGRNGDVPVDTGFIVFNYANYPHLTALFEELDVPVQPSDMSFGVSMGNGRLEYAFMPSKPLAGQYHNLLSPRFYRMVMDILRFNGAAEKLASAQPALTIGELVDDLQLGREFRDHYLFPICSAIWSTPTDGIGAFPADALVRFLRNHALLSVKEYRQWWTVSGGSRSYVDRLAAALKSMGVNLRAGTPVASVTREKFGVTVRDGVSEPEHFDQVIFACHSDQALKLLADASDDERSALGAVSFQPNRAVLHRDPSVMPRRKNCWSSWVYRSDKMADEAPATGASSVGVTYWMNKLQSIPNSDPLFVSLNPEIAIPDEAIYDETMFMHPLFDHGALAAQARIAQMQGQRHTWFTGAWLKNGFHEDGFASAVDVTRALAKGREHEPV